MNLCWLDPGRSPGTYLKLDLGEDKCTKKKTTQEHVFQKGICHQEITSLDAAANVNYGK